MQIDDDHEVVGCNSAGIDEFLTEHENFIGNKELRKTKTLLHLLKKIKNANTNVKLL